MPGGLFLAKPLSCMAMFRIDAALLICLAACSSQPPVLVCAETGGVCDSALRINELMASNDGAWVDEFGQTDDWVELFNSSDQPRNLFGYALADSHGVWQALPALVVPGGGTLLLWLDNDLTQGIRHLALKLSSAGETLRLRAPDGR